MVTPRDGQDDPRTGFAGRWYRPGMLRAPSRAAPVATAAILCVVLATACLPPPTAVSEPTTGPATSPAAIVTPQPSPSPKAQDLAIAAFTRQVTGGKLSYRIAFKGEVRLSVDRLPIAGSMDVSGADFASSFTYDFDPSYPGVGKYRVQVRAVDDRGWIKRGSAAWQQVKSYSAADSYVPFKTVQEPRDVRYLGPVKLDGTTYHKVAIRDAVLIHPNTLPYQTQKERVDDSEVQVLIDDSGRPRSGTWTLRGQARVGPGNGQLQRVVYDLQLTFSKVGSKLSIERP